MHGEMFEMKLKSGHSPWSAVDESIIQFLLKIFENVFRHKFQTKVKLVEVKNFSIEIALMHPKAFY